MQPLINSMRSTPFYIDLLRLLFPAWCLSCFGSTRNQDQRLEDLITRGSLSDEDGCQGRERRSVSAGHDNGAVRGEGEQHRTKADKIL